MSFTSLALVLTSVVLSVLSAADTGPDENDVVAGWTAFAIFGLLIAAVVVLGFSLTKRLKNVELANDQGLYDPSNPKGADGRPLRGLALARQLREQAATDQADGGTDPAAGVDATDGTDGADRTR